MNGRTFWILACALAIGLLVAPVTSAKQGSKATMDFDPDDFVRHIDNPFFPLEPGTTFFYEGTEDGVPTSNEMFVTKDRKSVV